MSSRLALRTSLLAAMALAASAAAARACPPSLSVEAAPDSGGAGAVLLVHAHHGCHPGALAVSGTAEGLAGGARQSIRLELAPAAAPGDFVVRRQWPEGGAWVLRLTVAEGGGHATVLVGIGPSGRIAAVRQPPRRGTIADPSETDVAAMLRSLAAG